MKQERMHQNPTDMGTEEFRQALELVGQWITKYRDTVASLPVVARSAPGEIRNSLPERAPARGEPVQAWLRDLEEIILPGMTHWHHPGFMAYFGLTSSGPGVLGEMIAAAMNVNGMLWKTSPACTELEQVVLRWYAAAMGLPADWFGTLTDTASTSTLVALAAAREYTELNIRENGMAEGPPLVLYCSEEAHSSVHKAAIVLGLGTRGVRRIPGDESFRMRADLLEQAVRRDFASGKRPFAVVATVGTTSSTAVDPVPAIARICREHKLWLHVDAAYAGTAAIAPEFRWALEGCEEADSLVTNPHKWLFTPIDCSALFTRRPELLHRTFSIVPEYLKSEPTGEINMMDYSFQLGRRFRAVKMWFVLRYFGTEGIAERIREHVRLARAFESWVRGHPDLELVTPADFSVVCFRLHPPGMHEEAKLRAFNEAVVEKVNASGEVFLSKTMLKEKFCLRIAVGNLQTGLQHLRRAFELVCAAADIPCTPAT